MTAASFVIDELLSTKLSGYLLGRGIQANAIGQIVRLAQAFTLLATYYANVFIFVANLLLAFAVFPREYNLWVFLIFYTVSTCIIIELGWLYDYAIIDITDKLQIFESPRLKCITVERWLRWSQVAFSAFTLIYFVIGLLLNP